MSCFHCKAYVTSNLPSWPLFTAMFSWHSEHPHCGVTQPLNSFLVKLKFHTHLTIVQVHKHTLSYTPTLCEWRVHVDVFMRAHLCVNGHACGGRNPCQISPLFVLRLIFLRQALPPYQRWLIQLDRVTTISALSPSLPSRGWASDPQTTVASLDSKHVTESSFPAYELILNSTAEFKTQLAIWFGRMKFCSYF